MTRIVKLFAISFFLCLLLSAYWLFTFHPDQHRQTLLRWFNQQSTWQLDYQQSTWQLSQPFRLTLHEVKLVNPEHAALVTPQLSLHINPRFLLSNKLQLNELNIQGGELALAKLKHEFNHALPLLGIDKLSVQSLDISYQNAHALIEVKRLDLALHGWHLQATSTPLNLIANAKSLQTPWAEIALPQLQLAWENQRLQLEHLSGDVFDGSFVASGAYHNKALHFDEVLINNPRITLSHVAWSKAFRSPLPWLKQISAKRVLLNQLSLAWAQGEQLLSMDKLTSEIDDAFSPWPPQLSALQGQFALIGDNINYQQLQLSELTARGALSQGEFRLDALHSQLYEGDIDLSLRYKLNEQALIIDKLRLENNELPIQPQWLNALSSRFIQSLSIAQLSAQKLNVLSYIDTLPLSIEGLNMELENTTPYANATWQNLDQLWQNNTYIFIDAPELALHGVPIKRLNMELGSEQLQGYINVYGELPLGQFELQAEALLAQNARPWQAKASLLALDLMPLNRLSSNKAFKLEGDLALQGRFHGQLQSFIAHLNGELSLDSQRLHLPRIDLDASINELKKQNKLTRDNALLSEDMGKLWHAPEQLKQGSTEFENSQLTFSVENGVLSASDTQLKSKQHRFDVQGKHDLREKQKSTLMLEISPR